MADPLLPQVNDNGAFTATPQPAPAAPPLAVPTQQQSSSSQVPPTQPQQSVPTQQPQQPDPLAALAAELGVSSAAIAAMGPNQQQLMLQQAERKKQFSSELQQTQAMIRQAMDPDAVRKYLPNSGKQTARTLLEDMLYNATQLNLRNPIYGSLAGHDYIPIQQQRMTQALKQHQDELQGLTESGRLAHAQMQDANANLAQYGAMARAEQQAQTAKAGQENQLRMEQETTYSRAQVAAMQLQMSAQWKALDWTNRTDVTGNQAIADGMKTDLNGFPVVPGKMYKFITNKAGGRSVIPETLVSTLVQSSTSTAEVPQTKIVDGKVVEYNAHSTRTNTRQRLVPDDYLTTPTRPASSAPPQPGAAATPTTPNPGPLRPRVAGGSSLTGGTIIGDAPADHKRKIEANDLTAAGKQHVSEVDRVTPQIDDVMDKLQGYKTSNVPLALAWPTVKYKLGMAAGDPDSLGHSISEISLNRIQSMMPYASRSRNFKYIQMIAEHTIDPIKDSGELMWSKLANIRRNFLTFKAAAMKDELLHSTGSNPSPQLSTGDAAAYGIIAGATWDPSHKTLLWPSAAAKTKARKMAQDDGWGVSGQ